MENKNKETITELPKDPRQYAYPQGTKIEIDGPLLIDLMVIFDRLITDEMKVESKFKYNYINEKGNVVKTPKKDDIETGKVKKILDFNRTIMEPSLDYSITEKGIMYAELKKFLELVHIENIKNGKAVDFQELAGNPYKQADGESK